ncbi:putative metalloreductase [Phaeomoniella chlamydospora]|uniref:ferric-chelate reductase (NADPH) n=1 Tax=Phaeomoniella chlamydospora TaxID=158046 RepID=A0A0G2GG25_PHACM|nr:putative metalloreductase [Phaeomoniella chlamydospora]
MDMSMSGMDMGSSEGGDDDMSNGVSFHALQRYYWAVMGAAIGLAALANVFNKLLARQRLSSGNARPKTIISTTAATATAIFREISNAPLGSFHSSRFAFSSPQLGHSILVLTNLVVVVVMSLYKENTLDEWSWEEIGYQSGHVALAQLPLIFLLAGKQNIIGFLVGVGYERLNWLHRWTARILWLNVTIHMGFWFRDWARYDYIVTKITTDPITMRGFAAWVILTFILITSFYPIRRLSYEIFVISHLVTFAGFVAAVWLHVPDEVKIFVQIPIGFYALDRVLRAANVLFSNLTIFHWRKRKNNDLQKGLWANKATLTKLPGNVTRISIDKPAMSWKAGQHVFLACHSVVPLQSHPFTIASLPSDDKMEFLVRAEKGGTKRFLAHASKIGELPLDQPSTKSGMKMVAVEGPYGRIRDLKQFDSVVLLAGSNGSTFTVPLMRDIVEAWMNEASCCYKPSKFAPKHLSVTRRIRYVWVIKSRDQLCWFSEQLDRVLEDVRKQHATNSSFDKEVEMSIYVTCDEELVAERTKSGTCCGAPSLAIHGRVEEVSSTTDAIINEKEKTDQFEVKSIYSSTAFSDIQAPTTSSTRKGGCNPDGTCCCASSSEKDEHTCECTHVIPSETTSSAIAATSLTSSIPSTSPRLRILSGRPHPKTIIRKVLEEAEGETGVVVCGPKGLRDDVRNSVVSLSDERAVHKGTGAQGIWVHCEGFGY